MRTLTSLRCAHSHAMLLMLFASVVAVEASAKRFTPVLTSPNNGVTLRWTLEDELGWTERYTTDPTRSTWYLEFPSYPARFVQGFTNNHAIGLWGYASSCCWNTGYSATYRLDFELDEEAYVQLSGSATGCTYDLSSYLTCRYDGVEIRSIDDQGAVLAVVHSIDATQDFDVSDDLFLEPGFYRLTAAFGIGTWDIGDRTFDLQLAIVPGPCGEFSCPACNDGFDNDGDGFCDGRGATCMDASTPGDADCFLTPARDTELPVCSDGIDNDGDGFVDLADPQCASADHRSETWVACGVGWELALLVPLIALARERRRRAARQPPDS